MPSPTAVELFVFGLEQRRYALLLDAVVRVVRMAAFVPLPRAPGIVLGMLTVAGELVPVLDLRTRFQLPSRRPAVEDLLVIARTRRRTVALPVQSVEGLQHYGADTIGPVDAVVPGVEMVRGAVKLPGDEMILIHDLDTFLSLEEEAALDRAVQEARDA
jgi:purine-binding chemotaxis protein CheW